MAEITPEWDWSQSEADRIQAIMNYYEDGVISYSGLDFKFAPLEEAAKFCQGGNQNPLYYVERPYGFHRTPQYIDFNTGQVNSAFDNGEQNYDLEIEKFSYI